MRLYRFSKKESIEAILEAARLKTDGKLRGWWSPVVWLSVIAMN